MNEQILIRFLTHQCSPEELELVNQWIIADKVNSEWLFEMERIWSLKNELLFSDKKEIETAYTEFLSKINTTKKSESSPKPKVRFMRYLKYAAAVVFIVLLAGNLYRINKAHQSSAENTVEVPVGQRASLTLSDGTKVWLNSQSKFTYPVDFKTLNRNVRLQGEGYFEVAHNPKSPFVVETSSVKVRVLGTKFNLKAYDEISSVTLREGKVQVSVDEIKKEVLLDPDEQAVYIKGKDTLEVSSIDADNTASWIDGIIIFDDNPMSEVLKTLSRHYDVTFEIKNPHINSMNLTMRLTGETLEQALEYLRLATGISYEIEQISDSVKGEKISYHVKLDK